MRDQDSFTSIEDYRRYKNRKQEVMEATEALVRLMTTTLADERDGARDGLAQALASEHPTNRQSFMRVFRDSCQELSNMGTDLRSEASQKLIRQIADFDEPIPYV